MSGHSKWSTIKRKKEKTDNARAKVFTKNETGLSHFYILSFISVQPMLP